jgi:SH3-like domain-containing protein
MLSSSWSCAVAVWVVTVPVADMLSRPAPEADLVSQALLGTTVEPLREERGWTRIRSADAYEGWTLSEALARLDAPYPNGRAVWVNSLFANLYHEPDVASRRPLFTAPYDAILEIAEPPESPESRWLRVRLPDRREAWVQRGDVRFDDTAISPGEAIALANRFAGVPYLWGGTSSFGLDCSGFTQLLLRRRGVRVPRDAAPQASWEGMTPIARADLEAGDLLYFGEHPEKITHTGMYIGGGEFIHATAHRLP